jgi:hypothetical protein
MFLKAGSASRRKSRIWRSRPEAGHCGRARCSRWSEAVGPAALLLGTTDLLEPDCIPTIHVRLCWRQLDISIRQWVGDMIRTGQFEALQIWLSEDQPGEAQFPRSGSQKWMQVLAGFIRPVGPGQ